ncbi:MAG: ABC transporter permease [Bacillota bacterium]
MIDTISSILFSTLRVAAPMAYATMGEIFTERSGVRNLGLEGVMLMGAVIGFSTAIHTRSLFLSVLAVLGIGLLIGLFYAVMTVTLQANQTVCGLSLVTFGAGLSGFIGKTLSDFSNVPFFGPMPIPGLSEIPVLGAVFFRHDLMIYFLYFLVIAAFLYIYKTRPGMVLCALGENPSALDVMGKNIFLMRYLYTMFGCMIVALGGAYITLAYTPIWQEGMIAGKGWIAVALVIFSAWNPVRAVLGSLLFAGIEVLSFRMQSYGIEVPSFFLSMLPYFCTIVVLIVSTGSFQTKRASAPAALGKYYEREAR